MGLVSWFRQRVTLPLVGPLSAFQAATGFRQGTMPIESVNNNLVVGAQTLGWHPLAGQVYHTTTQPIDAVGIAASTTKLYSWPITIPFRANLRCRCVFDLEYAGGTVQEFYLSLVIAKDLVTDSIGLNKVVRFARPNSTDNDIVPIEVRWTFWDVHPGDHNFRVRVVAGGGSGTGYIRRGQIFVHAVPQGNVLNVSGVQVG
jgi:hypothetical protein